MGEKVKHIFVINPSAGKKDSTKVVTDAIKKVLNEEDYIIYITKKPKDAWNFVHEYASLHQKERLRFYACGGDGTLNEVANGAYGFPHVSVGCYPVGSGNDFIKYFGTKEQFLDINNLVHGTIKEIDLLQFTDRFVVNILNIGFDANVADRMIKYKRLPLITGRGAYGLGVIVSLLSKVSNHFFMKIDGKQICDEDGLLCAVANGICYGGGYYCAPEAIVDDGLLDVCFVRKLPRTKFIGLIKYYKKGVHLQAPKLAPYLIYQKGKEVEIECKKPLTYAIDGEIGKTNKFLIRVVSKALRFIVAT